MPQIAKTAEYSIGVAGFRSVNTTLQGLKLTANGTDVSGSVDRYRLQINDSRNESVNRLNFDTLQSSSYVPKVQDEIEVFLGTEKIFSGGVVSFDQEYSQGGVVYSIKCNDQTYYLNRQLVSERYSNMTVADIIVLLRDKYAKDFTVNNVNCDLVIRSITFNYIPLARAVEKLAEVTNYSWYVDYNKDIHFFNKNAELAPFNLSDTTANYVYESLKYSEDITQLINMVTVRGGEEVGLPRTEDDFDTDGVRVNFKLAYRYDKKPVVTLNGTPLSVGNDFLDNPLDFDCLWSYQEQYIVFREDNKPSSGDLLSVSGRPLFDILTQVSNSKSIKEFGVWEYYLEDKELSSREQAIDFAQAKLQANAESVEEGEFSTQRSGLKSGQVIHIRSELRGIDAKVVIQSVRFKAFSNDRGEWKVTFATLKKQRMIEYLQDKLKGKKVQGDSDENILTLNTFSEVLSLADDVTLAEQTTAPYSYAPDNPADKTSGVTYGKYNFATYS